MPEIIGGPVVKYNQESVRPNQIDKMDQLNNSYYLPRAVTLEFRGGSQSDTLAFKSNEKGQIKLLPDARNAESDDNTVILKQEGGKLLATQGKDGQFVLTDKEVGEGHAALFRFGDNFLGVTNFSEEGRATFFKVDSKFLRILYKDFEGSSRLIDISLSKPSTAERTKFKRSRKAPSQWVYFHALGRRASLSTSQVSGLEFPASSRNPVSEVMEKKTTDPIVFEIGEKERAAILDDGTVNVKTVMEQAEDKAGQIAVTDRKPSKAAKYLTAALIVASSVGIFPGHTSEYVPESTAVVSPAQEKSPSQSGIVYDKYTVKSGDTYTDIVQNQIQEALGSEQDIDPSLLLLLKLATAGVNSSEDPDKLMAGETISVLNKDTIKKIADMTQNDPNRTITQWGDQLNEQYQNGTLTKDDLKKNIDLAVWFVTGAGVAS